MPPIIIKETKLSPSVLLDADKGIIEIKGSSIIEQANDFYKPVINFIETYCKNPKTETIISVQFDYCNNESAKCILAIFKKLESINSKDKKIIVNWLYNNQDMLEAGEEYKIIINMPFKMIPVSK